MSILYVDTSALVAFDEPGAASLVRRLDESAHLLSSNLLEAELRATFAREGIGFSASLVSGIEWILPERPLTSELTTVQRNLARVLPKKNKQPGFFDDVA